MGCTGIDGRRTQDHNDAVGEAAPRAVVSAGTWHRVGVGVLSILMWSSASAGPFSFTEIAASDDPGVLLGTFSLPSLNAAGQVVFRARETSALGSLQHVYVGAGDGITAVASADPSVAGTASELGSRPVINSSLIGFTQRFDSGGGNSGLYTVDLDMLGVQSQYLTSADGFSFIDEPSINDRNELAALVELSAGGGGVITSTGAGAFNLIAENLSFVTYDRPVLDEDGNVAFIAFGSGGSEVTITDFDGAAIAGVAQDFSGDFAGGFFGGSVDIASNVVSFNGGVGPSAGLFASDRDGPIDALVTNLDGFLDLDTHVATEAGAIVFQALPVGGSRGIYTGLNAVSDKVIAVGDTVNDKLVTGVQLGDANASGQIALVLDFDDGSSGVYRADPGGSGLTQFDPVLPVFRARQDPVLTRSLTDHLDPFFDVPEVGQLLFEGLGGDPLELPDLPITTVAYVQAMIFDAARSGAWFDPPSTQGFFFEMTTDALFTDILDFPLGFDADFRVLTDFGLVPGTFGAGDSVNFFQFFGESVSRFTIFDINPAVDTGSLVAFPIQLAFDQPTADFVMLSIARPSARVPAPASLGLALCGVLALFSLRRRRGSGTIVCVG